MARREKTLYYPLGVRIGRRLRESRMEKDMTQEALGAAVGIPARTISRIEHAKARVTIEMLLVMADVLGTNINQWFEERGD